MRLVLLIPTIYHTDVCISVKANSQKSFVEHPTISPWKTCSSSAKYRVITGCKLFSRTSKYIWELIFHFTSLKVPIPLKDKHPRSSHLLYVGKVVILIRTVDFVVPPDINTVVWSNNYLTFIRIYIFPPVRINSPPSFYGWLREQWHTFLQLVVCNLQMQISFW